MGLKGSVATTCCYTQKQMWKTANLEKAVEVSMALIALVHVFSLLSKPTYFWSVYLDEEKH